MDPASQQWATEPGAVDNLDVRENAGDAAVNRDRSVDPAAPTSAEDDNEEWGQRDPGGAGTRAHRAQAAARHAAAATIEHDPVLVRLADEPVDVIARAADDWSVTATPNVSTVPSQVLGRQETRRGLLIVNTGSSTVYLASSQAALGTVTNGFPVASGGVFGIETKGAVWAATSAGAGALSIVITFDVVAAP